jgi:hypothetical protein
MAHCGHNGTNYAVTGVVEEGMEMPKFGGDDGADDPRITGGP